jgi:hypothetical protein
MSGDTGNDPRVSISAGALEAILMNRLCNVCVGVSPPWDGHDKNPKCVGAAREDICRALDPTLAAADAAMDTVAVDRELVERLRDWDNEMGRAGLPRELIEQLRRLPEAGTR